jgi:hypothetical protein
MAKSFDVESSEFKASQAAFGAQEYLRFGVTAAPGVIDVTDIPWPGAGNSTYDTLQSERLIDLGTSEGGVALPALGPGTYYATFPMNGMASVNVYLNFVFAGGTLTANGFTTFKDHFSQNQAFTGNGALTTATPATLTMTTPKGEQYALLQLIVGSGCTVTDCDQAEYCGQRG